MKRRIRQIFAFALIACLLWALTACGAQPGGPAASTSMVSTPTQPGGGQAQTPGAAPATGTETPDADASGAEEGAAPEETAGSRVLVAYFSCTGHTKDIAERAAAALGADLYEIVPETAYTDADLNYSDPDSRSTREQNDDTSRPAISGSVENMDGYDTVIIGYPIWWGQAPKILYTFLESYDFSGKTIVPFCTSASSGVGSSATNLQSAANSANWLEGVRFSAGLSEAELTGWLEPIALS